MRCHMPGYIRLKVWVKEWCGFFSSYTHDYAYIMLCELWCGLFSIYFSVFFFFHLLFINMTIIYKNVLLDFYWSCLSSGRNGKFGSYFLLCIHWMTKRVVCGMLCIWYAADLIFCFREGFPIWIIRWIEMKK